MESHIRSITKALSWRFIATLITCSVAWFVTRKFTFAMEIGVIDTLIKLGAYYSHERAWNRVRLGKPKQPE